MNPAFQLKNILVPVDFSRCSLKAVHYAVAFARQFDAELTLLHVISPVVAMPTSEMAPQGFLEESATAARESLEDLRRSLGEDVHYGGSGGRLKAPPLVGWPQNL